MTESHQDHLQTNCQQEGSSRQNEIVERFPGALTEEQKAAFEALHTFLRSLSERAGWQEVRVERLWMRVQSSEGILRELAYFHDTGSFWGGYEIAGYTISDILVWQVDHFKAYMDRHEEMNRYRRERLFLESLEAMTEMERDPEPFIRKIQGESGTDREDV